MHVNRILNVFGWNLIRQTYSFTENFHNFSQSTQKNAGVVTQIVPRMPPSTFYPIHHLL